MGESYPRSLTRMHSGELADWVGHKDLRHRTARRGVEAHKRYPPREILVSSHSCAPLGFPKSP